MRRDERSVAAFHPPGQQELVPNGTGDEKGLRKLSRATVARSGGIHLFLGMHLLPAVRALDGCHLSQLRRRADPTSDPPPRLSGRVLSKPRGVSHGRALTVSVTNPALRCGAAVRQGSFYQLGPSIHLALRCRSHASGNLTPAAGQPLYSAELCSEPPLDPGNGPSEPDPSQGVPARNCRKLQHVVFCRFLPPCLSLNCWTYSCQGVN